jgi:hypothetical protein
MIVTHFIIEYGFVIHRTFEGRASCASVARARAHAHTNKEVWL